MARQKQPVFFILFFVCSLLFSCRPVPQYPEELLQANLLTQTNPDSALQVLEAMSSQMQHASEPILRYYQLLTIKAKDKAFITHTSDSLILSLLHYYEEKGDIRLLPEACYYAGRVTRDLGDAPQALDYFHQALDAMSQPSYQQSMKGKEHDNLQLQGKIHAQMGYLFKRQHLYGEAIKSFEQAYRIDSINKDTMGMMLSLEDVGSIYRHKKEYEKAIGYYDRAETIAASLIDTANLYYIYYQQAILSCDIKDYDKVKKYLEILPINIPKVGKSASYSILAGIYSSISDDEKASFYYEKLLCSNDIIARSNANIWLANRAKNFGNAVKAIEYIDSFILLEDTINTYKNEELIGLSQSLYNYHLREKEIAELKLQRTTLTARLWMVAAITMLSILLLYVEHNRRKRIKQQYEHLQRIIDNQKLQTMQKQDLLRIAVANLKNSTTYKMLVQKSISKDRIADSDWREIESLFNRIMPEFIPKLQGIHSYNDTEWKLSLLLKLDFSLSQIAALIGLTYEAIHSSQARLFRKVLKNDVTYKSWKDFVSTL